MIKEIKSKNSKDLKCLNISIVIKKSKIKNYYDYQEYIFNNIVNNKQLYSKEELEFYNLLLDNNNINNNSNNNKDLINIIEDNTNIYNNYYFNIDQIHIIKNYIDTALLSDILLGINKRFEFCCLNNLKILNLTANNIESIPCIINQFINLEILILNNNKIATIENIDKLNNLIRLELRSNKISNINNLGNNSLINEINSNSIYPKLKILSLSCNLIKEIDINNIPNLDSLKEFGLFGNYIGNSIDYNDLILKEKLTQVINVIKIRFKNLSSMYLGGNGVSMFAEYEYTVKLMLPNLLKLDGIKI